MSTILAQDQITLYSFSDGADGKNAITAALTNDSHVIPCDKNGLNGNYTGANSSLIIYEGATDVTNNWTVKVTASSGVTGSLSGKTYTVTGITVDSGYVDFIATRSGYSQITKRFNITRTKVGATGGTGAASTTYWMVTSASIISKSQSSVLTPSSITFSAKSQTGTANPANYSGRYAIFINGSATAAYTSSANETSKVYTIPSGTTSIRCVLYQAGGTTTVLDEQTIPVVSDGKNGTNGTNGKTYVLNILNGTRGVTYNTSGTNPVPAMSAFSCELYENGTKVTPASYSWSVPSSASLLSGSSTTATFTPTIASAFDGTKGNNAIFLTVTYAGQTVKQSVVISATKVGDKGDKGNSGSNGKTYVLSITGGKTTILYNASGASPTPSSLGTFSCELYENGTKVTSGITYTWSVPSTNSVLSKPSATTAATFSPGLLTSGFNTNTHYDNTITLTVSYSGQTIRATQPIAVSRTGDTGGKGDKGEQGKAGTDSINVVCSNESELYPSNTSGNVTPAKSVTTQFTAYQGTTIVPCTVKLPTAPSGMTISQATANNIVTVTLTVANNATLGNSATLSGTLDFEVTAGGRTFVKTFSWSKVKTGNTGATGAAAKAVDVTASSQVFKSTDGGITFSPNTITLTPTYQGGLAFSKWQYSQDGGVTWKDVASGSNGLTVSNGILTVNKTCNLFTTTITSLSFKVITNNASYYDVISIIKLYDVTDIEIGGRNYLKQSAITYKITNSSSPILSSINTTESLDLNDLLTHPYTLSFFVYTPGEHKSIGVNGTNTRFGMHGTVVWTNSDGTTQTNYPFLFFSNWGKDGRISVTGQLNHPSGATSIKSISFAIQLTEAPNDNNKEVWIFSHPKFEKGNKATDWTPAPEDVTSSIENVQNNLNNFSTTVNGSFKDGIIQQSEALAIKQNINLIQADKAQLDKDYAAVYANVNLTGTPKTNLASAKTDYDSKFNTLTTTINNAISDGKATASEATAVNTAFTNYKTSLGTLQQRLQEALDAISSKKISNISVSTRNLLRNTSYEKDIVGTNNRGTYHVLSRDTANSYNNNYSLKVVCNTKSVSGTNDVWQMLWDALIPNENLMLSFYVKGSVATTAWIRVVPASSNAMPTFNITTDWKRVIIDLGKVSASGTRGATELIYGFNATGTFYMNSMMLHYGNTPSAWTPAPEDTEELITTVTTTLAAVKLTVDEDHKSIVGKVWQSDITNKINSYDSTTSKALRDRVSKTETDITGIKNTVSDVQTTISKKADGTTVTELTNRLAKAEQDANGFKQTVKNTYATQTNLDKTNNKVTNLQQTGLGWKVNYSAFATADNGEIYLHGYEGVEGKAADVDGWVLWNGAKVTIPKGKIDPNAICPYAAPIYIVRRTSNNTTYLVWYNSGWKWSVSQPTAVGGTWTWVTATDIVLGAFVEPSSEAAIVGAQLFTPPKTADEIKISSEVSSSIVQKANEITNTVSKTYQTKADASQISQKVDSITNKVTTAQGDITKLQQTAKEITSTVTNTNKRIDDISVGSVNIATGTNNGNVGWTWSMQAGTYTGESITEDEINCCKLTRNDDAQTGWSVIQYSSIGRNKYLANTEYIISIEIKPSVDTSFSANLIESNGTNSLLAVTGSSSNVAKDTWNKVAWHIKTKETLPDSLAQVLYLTGMASTVGVSYMFRNLKIEKGNLTDPTDWTPAPEDIDSEFSKVSQDITGITSTVKDIGDNVSKVQQTAEELNVNFSTLSDDLSGLSNKVGETNEKIERNYSNINASIDSITSEINSVKEDVIQNSEILQTADGWKALFAQLGMYDVPDVVTNVLMSIRGIEVSNPQNGTKTMMTTERFAGYYNDGTMTGDGIRTFGLEKDQVIAEKVVVNKGCDFITSKLVPITYDNSNVKHPALVFVKSNT